MLLAFSLCFPAFFPTTWNIVPRIGERPVVALRTNHLPTILVNNGHVHSTFLQGTNTAIGTAATSHFANTMNRLTAPLFGIVVFVRVAHLQKPAPLAKMPEHIQMLTMANNARPSGYPIGNIRFLECQARAGKHPCQFNARFGAIQRTVMKRTVPINFEHETSIKLKNLMENRKGVTISHGAPSISPVEKKGNTFVE